MTCWIAEDEAHVKTFEVKCSKQGISTQKHAPGQYTDPLTAKLWDFYSQGVQLENNKWQADFA